MGKGLLEKIRAAEEELVYAPPARAAYLTRKIVKWKGQVFVER